jgi:hypothetical protein
MVGFSIPRSRKSKTMVQKCRTRLKPFKTSPPGLDVATPHQRQESPHDTNALHPRAERYVRSNDDTESKAAEKLNWSDY